jgi:hypothetical protein
VNADGGTRMCVLQGHIEEHAEEHAETKAAHDQLEAENARLQKALARKERALESSEERRRDLGSEAVQSKAANLALAQTISAQEEELDVRLPPAFAPTRFASLPPHRSQSLSVLSSPARARGRPIPLT